MVKQSWALDYIHENVQPRNGFKSFFTEDSYAKWFGRESHETRLAENLRKAGISLLPGDLTPCKTTTKPEPEKEEPLTHDTSETLTTQRPTESSRETTRPRKNPVKLSKKLLSKSNVVASTTTLSDNDTASTTEAVSISDDVSSVTPAENVRLENYKEPDRIPVSSNVCNGTDSRQRYGGLTLSSETIIAEPQTLPELSESLARITPEAPESSFSGENEKGNMLSNQSLNNPASLIPSQSAPKQGKGFSKNQIDGNAPRPTVTSMSLTERPSKEEIKKLMAENILYFNFKDRTDKYIPKIAEKKPHKKKSVLLSQEQRLYSELHRKYGKLLPQNPNAKQQEEIDKYKMLRNIVHQEQKHFMSYLRFAASQCEDDYLYMHPEAKKYISAKLLSKRTRVWKYPRYYRSGSKFRLPDCIPHHKPTLQYVRPLLELGSVCRMVLPSIIPGCPQPCTPTNYSEISSVCPPIRDKVEGPLVWHYEECSNDVNVEQLAVPNKCNIALSACTLKYLIDNQGFYCKYWHIPVTIREYNLTEGDKNTTHRVIFLDKPLIRTSEYTNRDKNLMFQKHALRSVALRPKQKVVTFSRVKPISTVQKAPEIDELSKEISKWEKVVEASVGECGYLANTVGASEESDDDNDPHRSAKKRWPKHRGTNWKNRDTKPTIEEAQPHSKGVGVFDIEKDLDDLETFGMDNLLLPKQNKPDPSPKKPENKTKRLSTENELELLKQELQGIKSLAQKDFEKRPGGLKSAVRKSDKKIDHDKDSNQRLSEVMQPETFESHIADVSIQECAPTVEMQDEHQPQNKISDADAGTDIEGKVEIKTQTTQDISVNKSVTANVGKLSVKSVSSLSSIMKRMSTVKAKLMERNEQRKKSDDSMPDSWSETNTTGTDIHQSVKVYSTRNRTSTMKTEPQASDGVATLTESDTDTENDGLIIDIPDSAAAASARDIPESPDATKQVKMDTHMDEISNSHETIESPPASPVNDTGTLELPNYDAPQSPDMDSVTPESNACVIIPLEESNNEEVIRDYSLVKFEGVETITNILTEPADMKTETGNAFDEADQDRKDSTAEESVMIKSELDISATVTRGSKRRSSEMIASPTKRFLRSRVTKEETKETTDEKDNVSAEIETEDKPFIVTRGRGKQREVVNERVTRSRSVSVETKQNTCSSTTIGSRKGTRHSLDSISAETEVPIKRRRGRPPKNTVEGPQSVVHNIVTAADSITADQDHSKTDDTDFRVTEVDDIKKEDGSSALMVSDASTCNSENLAQSLPKRRGRPPKRSSQDLIEAKKVHEMAEAMKRKLAEKQEAAQHDAEIPKINENTVSAVSKEGKKYQEKKESVKVTANQSNIKAQSSTETFKQDQQVKKNTGAKQEQSAGNSAAGHSLGVSAGPVQTSDIGLENILTMQKDMLKPTATKSLTHESFAGKHGMQRMVYPANGNVTYHQWMLRDTNLLVRCSYHGHTTMQGLVHLSPKMEYQPYFGFERETVNETARNWISVYVRPNSSLARTRINPFNSEVMMLEHVNFTDLIPPESGFKSLQAFADLDTICQNLKSLLPGQYLLGNNPFSGKMNILEATEGGHGTFDLHGYHASFTKGRNQPKVQWVPIDTNLLLPHHKRLQLTPCLYQAKDEKGAKFAQKKKGKKQRRKNKK